MYKWLLGTGLVLIPLFTVAGEGSTWPKLYLALAFSLALFLMACFQGTLGRVSNVWLLLFMAYIPVSLFFAPRLNLPLNGVVFSSPWLWQSALFVLVFFLLYVSITGQKFTAYDIYPLFQAVVWLGVVLSLFIFAQKMGLDQWFSLTSHINAAHVPSKVCGATLGHPLYAGTFLAIMVPLSVYLRRWVAAVIIVTAIIVTQSQMAIVSLVMSMFSYLAFTSKKRLILLTILGVCLSACLVFLYFTSPKVKAFVGDSGRFTTWETVVKNFNAPPVKEVKKTYAITGAGLGSFPVMFHKTHGGHWLHAHNEYLEITYEIGIAGLLLLIMAFIGVFKGMNFTEYHACLYACIVASMVTAIGLFNWHFGPHLFYTITMIGLTEVEG